MCDCYINNRLRELILIVKWLNILLLSISCNNNSHHDTLNTINSNKIDLNARSVNSGIICVEYDSLKCKSYSYMDSIIIIEEANKSLINIRIKILSFNKTIDNPGYYCADVYIPSISNTSSLVLKKNVVIIIAKELKADFVTLYNTLEAYNNRLFSTCDSNNDYHKGIIGNYYVSRKKIK